MTATLTLDAWRDALEAALADDSDESWARALEASADDVELVFEPDDVDRHLEELRELGDRLATRHALTLDELDAVTDERRHLVTHSRAVTSYRMAESLAPVERLMRMMWVG